jgi:hypothetical protein
MKAVEQFLDILVIIVGLVVLLLAVAHIIFTAGSLPYVYGLSVFAFIYIAGLSEAGAWIGWPAIVICALLEFFYLRRLWKSAFPSTPPRLDFDIIHTLSLPCLEMGVGFRAKGMTNYSVEFELAREALGAQPGQNVTTPVVLTAEPENPHSHHAVSVSKDGWLLGYVPEQYSLSFFELVQSEGGQVRCHSQIYFDHSRNSVKKNSVLLYAELPPSIERDFH